MSLRPTKSPLEQRRDDLVQQHRTTVDQLVAIVQELASPDSRGSDHGDTQYDTWTREWLNYLCIQPGMPVVRYCVTKILKKHMDDTETFQVSHYEGKHRVADETERELKNGAESELKWGELTQEGKYAEAFDHYIGGDTIFEQLDPEHKNYIKAISWTLMLYQDGIKYIREFEQSPSYFIEKFTYATSTDYYKRSKIVYDILNVPIFWERDAKNASDMETQDDDEQNDDEQNDDEQNDTSVKSFRSLVTAIFTNLTKTNSTKLSQMSTTTLYEKGGRYYRHQDIKEILEHKVENSTTLKDFLATKFTDTTSASEMLRYQTLLAILFTCSGSQNIKTFIQYLKE